MVPEAALWYNAKEHTFPVPQADLFAPTEPPVIPDGDELYDLIVGAIEPELTTAQLPTLREKYKDETPEEAEARAERYEQAFVEYDKRFALYLTELHGNVQAYRHASLASTEKIDREEDEKALGQLESSISSI